MFQTIEKYLKSLVITVQLAVWGLPSRRTRRPAKEPAGTDETPGIRQSTVLKLWELQCPWRPPVTQSWNSYPRIHILKFPPTMTRADLGKPIGYCGNNVWHLGLGHKGHYDFCLALFWSHNLGEASCRIVSTLKQPYEELHVAKNQGLQSRAIKWVVLELDPSPSQAFRQLPTSCLQPWWHPLRQNHPVVQANHIYDQKPYEIINAYFGQINCGITCCMNHWYKGLCILGLTPHTTGGLDSYSGPFVGEDRIPAQMLTLISLGYDWPSPCRVQLGRDGAVWDWCVCVCTHVSRMYIGMWISVVPLWPPWGTKGLFCCALCPQGDYKPTLVVKPLHFFMPSSGWFSKIFLSLYILQRLVLTLKQCLENSEIVFVFVLSLLGCVYWKHIPWRVASESWMGNGLQACGVTHIGSN